MAQILTSYYRPKPTGLCKRLFMAIRALLDKGHTVHYLAVEPFPIPHAKCVFHRFPWPVSKTDTILFWAVFHLLAPLILIWLSLRHNISHTFGISTTYAGLLKAAAFIRGAKTTCFLHADAAVAHRLNKRPGWVIAMDRWVEGVALYNATVVGLQKDLTRAVVDRHPLMKPSRIALLPNNLEIKEMRKKDVKHPVRIAMVGALDARKNHSYIIDTMTSIPACYELFIYGAGILDKELERRARDMGVGNRVHFMGWVPSDSIWPQIELLVMPSLHEGMPEAVLEAIANGVAVLASDIPAHREVLPRDHLLPLGDKQKWCGKLMALLDDPGPKLSRMVRRQSAKALKFRFDWDARIVSLITGS